MLAGQPAERDEGPGQGLESLVTKARKARRFRQQLQGLRTREGRERHGGKAQLLDREPTESGGEHRPGVGIA